MSYKKFDDISINPEDSNEAKVQIFLEAIENHPEGKIDFLLELMQLYKKMELFDKLLTCCEDIIETSPRRVPKLKAYRYIVNEYIRQNNYALAIAALQKSYEIDKTNVRILFEIGECYVDMEDYDNALKTYELALKTPDQMGKIREEDYFVHIAEVYYLTKNYKGAIDAYLKMLEKDPDSAEVLRALASIYYEQRNFDIAKPYFERYIELYPNKDAHVYFGLAFCYNDKAEPKKVLELMSKALELNEETIKDKEFAAAICNYMGKLYWMELRDAENSIEYFIKMMHEIPTDSMKSEASVFILRMSMHPKAYPFADKYYKEFAPKEEVIEPQHTPLTTDEIINLPYYYKNIPANHKEQKAFLKQMKTEFEKDIENNPQYNVFFEKYEPESIKDFKQSYVEHKVRLLECSSYLIEKHDDKNDIRFRKETETVIEIIMQKKLFNKQLLWRAEKIKIPEIRIAYEFEQWERDIHNCPFLEDITPEEIAVMKSFLLEYDDVGYTSWFFNNWQDYDELMMKNEEGEREEMPEFYKYYDIHFGTEYLLDLPNIRGEKEEFYQDIWRKWNTKKTPPPKPTSTQVSSSLQTKPTLNAFFENFSKFMKKYENDYINQLHTSYITPKIPQNENFDSESIESAILIIEEADRPLYFDSGLVWYEAIFKCANQYKNSCIANNLEIVYDYFLMKKELKLNTQDEKNKFDAQDQLRDMIIENIIKGRELNGEPADLNF